MKTNMAFVFLLFFTSCKGKKADNTALQPFNAVLWTIQQEGVYTHRADMLHYLMEHYTLKGISKDSLTLLLGQPDRSNEGYWYYHISSERLPGLPIPLGTRTLVIKLTKDSTVEWRKVHG